MVAKALTIAGSDSGGGAGIQADLKAFSVMGVYGASVITAVTAQNTRAVTAIHAVPDDVVAAQIAAVLSDIDIGAIKIGMPGTPSLIARVAKAIAGFSGPVVLDPVMVAKSGDILLADTAIDALKKHLLPRASLLTPNLPEAAKLLGLEGEGRALAQAHRLLELGLEAVLIKGGHAAGEICCDYLCRHEGDIALEALRVNTANTHGWLHQANLHSDALQVGRGHGPVHHFHGVWS